MMGLYMLFVNILLLNLLIAIFSHSIAKIQVQSENHWVYQRYFLIKEYVSRNVYYPPLNVIWMVITIIRCCVEKRNVFKDNSRHFREYVNVRASQIKKLQASAVKACDESRKDNVDAKIQATHEMLHQMSGRINLVEAKIIDEIHEMEKRMNVFETKILEELKTLRKQNGTSNMTRGVKADV
ncbi:hypothetical protein DPMN_019966 [Dreissena polymorpha]|uniref:Uncharacterized protein n=1 Tax=Dreissena polymorpha TaxID=45954 RepID=A0A9D4S7S9_DREPO|nr:hypothetical protein DPMN_019966 [Dreissena polymorpha]